MTLRVLRQEIILDGLERYVPCNHKGPFKEEAGGSEFIEMMTEAEVCRDVLGSWRKGPQAKECRQPGHWMLKTMEVDSSLEPLEGPNPACTWTAHLTPVRLLLTLELKETTFMLL